jgi:methylenetetrahydrofolate dehydrogenase (NADP+) / methenyltetrahydrofolate cyclohydrolase
MSSKPLILNGKELAAKILKDLTKDVVALEPTLVIIQIGEDPRSSTYIARKMKACAHIHMTCTHTHLPDTTKMKDLISLIKELNADKAITGYILQLPLPDHLQSDLPEIIKAFDPKKDVDGFCAYNIGKVFLSKEFEHLPPATPLGVIRLLEHYDITVDGKDIVIVGASNLVGKPLAIMLLNRNATVTVCHVKTKDLYAHTRTADILISAVGRPGLIPEHAIKEGAVVIDIGISEIDDPHTPGKKCIVGDIVFEDVKEKVSSITPVPGGVGPMTVASLLQNVVTAAKRQNT